MPSHSAALLLVAGSDLVGLVPARLSRGLLASLGLVSLDLGLELPAVTIAQAWHPRHEADAPHRWLRARMRDTMRQAVTLDPA